jgi:hypothetical protein
VLALVAHVAEAAVPYIAAWPRSYSRALVLTHDIETHADGPSAWWALPHEVAAWWRRQASQLVGHGKAWRVEGAAAGEAEVAYVEPQAAEQLLAGADVVPARGGAA